MIPLIVAGLGVILLFVDATEVRDGFLAGERALVARLLLIALPLSLPACLLLGLGMFHPSSWSVVPVIACVVMPIDFAPAARLLKDRHLPLRVRHVLAVESGYNDGFFSPVFLYAVLLLGGSEHGGTPASALRQAVPAAGWDDADLALGVAAVVILGSLLLHGFALPLVLRRQAVRAGAARAAGQQAVRKG